MNLNNLYLINFYKNMQESIVVDIESIDTIALAMHFYKK